MLQTPALRNFRVTPYALGNALKSGVAPVDTDLDYDVGGDVKYSLTPSLTLDATVNTDFAQVEVDDQQVNLDRFTLFFPEKRPFFLENAGFFTVGNPGEVDLFFSRRIGIGDNGQSIPIMGGGRVSGKAGKFNVGLLNMQTSDYNDIVASTNFSVARVSRDLPNRSSIGAIFTNRQETGEFAVDDGYGRTFGFDGKLGLGMTTVVSGFVARTQTPEVDDSDHAFNVRSQTNRPQWDLNVGYQEVGDGFNPAIGFLSRRGYRKPDLSVMTRFRPQDFINIQELRPHTTFRGFWGLDGFQETGYLHLDNHWQFRDSTEIHTGMNLTREGVRTPFEIYPGIFVPPGTYDHAEAQLVAMSNQGAPFSVSMRATIGGFFGGDRVALNPTVRFRAGDALTTEIEYQRNDIKLPVGDFVTNLVRTRVSYSFSPRIFTQALIQYNDRADLWSMNFRFGWLQAANTGLFVVYTDTRGLYRSLRPSGAHRSFVDGEVLVHAGPVQITPAFEGGSKRPASTYGSIRQIIRTTPDMIGRRIFRELDGGNRRPSRERGLRDAMPAIHHLAVRRQDDRKRQVGLLDQPHVFDERAPRLTLVIAGPGPIELAELVEGNLAPREILRQCNEPIDVPGLQAGGRRPKMVPVSACARSSLSPFLPLARAAAAPRSRTACPRANPSTCASVTRR